MCFKKRKECVDEDEGERDEAEEPSEVGEFREGKGRGEPQARRSGDGKMIQQQIINLCSIYGDTQVERVGT